MYRLIGVKDGTCIVLEDNIISEGVARAKYRQNIAEYSEDYTTVKIDNSSTKHIGI